MIGALLVGLVAALSPSLEAQCTVSQGRGPNYGLQDTQAAPLGGLKVGQSFVACATGTITAVTTALSFGSGGARTTTFRLYEGAGYGGAELASKANQVFAGNGADTLIDLTSGAVGKAAVVAGQVYTFSLEVADTTSNAVTMLFMNNNQNGNPYPDGTAFNMAGQAQAKSDLYFTIAISPAPPRYVDQGDGTVKDIKTGLIWLKDASCMGKETFDQAQTEVATIWGGGRGCGLSDSSKPGDWRLPTKQEWEAMIVRNPKCNPAITDDQGTGCYSGGSSFTGVQGGKIDSAYYWSSTPDPGRGGTIAWAANVTSTQGGDVVLYEKRRQLYLWPVRDATP